MESLRKRVIPEELAALIGRRMLADKHNPHGLSSLATTATIAVRRDAEFSKRRINLGECIGMALAVGAEFADERYER